MEPQIQPHGGYIPLYNQTYGQGSNPVPYSQAHRTRYPTAERESPTPPPVPQPDLTAQQPPTVRNDGKQRATSARDDAGGDDIHPALRGLGTDANVEGSGIEEDSQFIINSLIFQLTATQAEVTHLRATSQAEIEHLRATNGLLTKQIQQSRKRTTPSDESITDTQRPHKKQDVGPREESQTRIMAWEGLKEPTPYNEDVVMRNDGFVEQGYEEPIIVRPAGNLLPNPPAVTDPTPPTPPAHSSDESDDECGEIWTEDEDEIAERKGGKRPSHEEMADIIGHNRVVRAKRFGKRENEKRKRQEDFERMPGRVPDGLGVFIPQGGMPERDNMMSGMWSGQVYHSNRSNMVFVGNSAAIAARYEAKSRSAFIPHRDSPMHAIYALVPRGVPHTQRDVNRLVALCFDNKMDPIVRVDAYCILSEFADVTSRIHPDLHDRAMSHISDPEVFNKGFQPDVSAHLWEFEPIPRDLSRVVTGNVNNATGGAGLRMPAVERLLDIDFSGQYIMLHGRPGSANPYHGIAMDRSFRVHRRSLFGYGLGRILAPSSQQGRTAFMRLFAILTACAGRYNEAVNAYNASNPGSPFVPQSGPTFALSRLRIDGRHVMNMTMEDVIATLIYNRIPVEWIDHAYLYGLHFMSQRYAGSTLDDDLLAEYDDERLHRIDLYGVPSAITAWDGWRIPTTDDLLRLSIVMKLEEENKGLFSLDGPNWLLFGESPFRRYLTSRPEEIARPALERYRLRIGYSATINPTPTLAPGPGTQALAVNAAVGNTDMAVNAAIPERLSSGASAPADVEMEEEKASTSTNPTAVPEVSMQNDKDTSL